MYTHAYEDSIRITFVYRKLPLQFEGKIRAVNAFSLDMCEFPVILYISSLKTHLVSFNHHQYTAACSVTLLPLNPVIMVLDQEIYADHFRISSKYVICLMTVKDF